jgi:hypothetical protein
VSFEKGGGEGRLESIAEQLRSADALVLASQKSQAAAVVARQISDEISRWVTSFLL